MKNFTLSSLFLLMTGVVNVSALPTPSVKSGSSAQAITIRPAEKPFWREKEDVFARITELRAVIVSVQTEDLQKDSGQRLITQGAGLVAAPLGFTYAQAKKFENIPSMTSYVRKVRYKKERQELFMHLEAFAYHARIWMRVELDEESTDKQIRFRIIKGVFKGMEGVFAFEDYRRRKTQISMTASYEFDKLPVPAFFARFGLEWVLQKMAERLRDFVEESYRKS